MRLRIDSTTPVPPFEQLRAQIALQVATGRMGPGDRLPTIRSLADELHLSPNTVARAYRELIEAGIAVAGGRGGTRIASAPPVAYDIAQRNEELTAAATEFARHALDLDVPIDEAIEAFIIARRALQV